MVNEMLSGLAIAFGSAVAAGVGIRVLIGMLVR